MNRIAYAAFVCCLILFSFPALLNAQRSLTVDDLEAWRRITQQHISNDGNWIAVKAEPWIGDPIVRVYKNDGNKIGEYNAADQYVFSSSSRYIVIRNVPAKALTDSLKLKKTKADDMPMNSLLIKNLSGNEEAIDSIKNYSVAESADWMAYQRGAKKDSTLYVRSLDGSKSFQYPVVKEYKFAKKSGLMAYVSGGDTLGIEAGLYIFDPDKGTTTLVKQGAGSFKQVTFDESGNKLAFLYCEDKDKDSKELDLWLSENGRQASLIAGKTNPAFPNDWVISGNGQIRFTKDNERLFFGTAPTPKEKDTTQLAENRPNVQVWSWDEPVQYTVQTFNKANDLKKSYAAVYNIGKGTIFQLATPEIPDFTTSYEGGVNYGLVSTSLPYGTASMWEGRVRNDYYIVSLETGEHRLAIEADYGRLRVSPNGKYAFWYAPNDSSWYTLSLADCKQYRLTTPETFAAWNAENDTPDYPSAYGAAGWTSNDQYLLIYDRYDIWRFDPTGKAAPVNLTVNGSREQLRYRRIQLDVEEQAIDLNQTQYFQAFNEKNKGTGYYAAKISSPTAPKALLAGDFTLRRLAKAKNADALIYTQESFEVFPDIHYTDKDFRNKTKITREVNQQEGINWGTAELVSWYSFEGFPIEGVLYKPSDFDPNKKYPMIVNFYEKNSETLLTYHMPEAHRSTIDYHLYLSNGYLIFNPDIHYRDGYPGESCFNSLMPGVTMLIDKGFVDEKAIGAQGHSWGGYQVAYLATRTNLFAAIESGAPVVNMFSAYGGIRWGSGLARSFQYEHTQSRIAGTPWDKPLRFFENSPLFTMDKVETPILIMHNDEDGHVPWYQGIEYFVALKRLQKPAWLLNYTGEPHWPLKPANKKDFQIRMMQFFDHFLKGKPMPKWMEEGVKAVDQEFELGY